MKEKEKIERKKAQYRKENDPNDVHARSGKHRQWLGFAAFAISATHYDSSGWLRLRLGRNCTHSVLYFLTNTHAHTCGAKGPVLVCPPAICPRKLTYTHTHRHTHTQSTFIHFGAKQLSTPGLEPRTDGTRLIYFNTREKLSLSMYRSAQLRVLCVRVSLILFTSSSRLMLVLVLAPSLAFYHYQHHFF